MNGIFITAYSFVAAVIGAGFASGQEILSFFVVNGKWGAVGIILSALIFGGFTYFILEACRVKKVDDYNTLINKIMSSRIKKISNLLTLIFLFCSLAVMIACFGEMAYTVFEFDKAIATIIFTAVCTGIVCAGSDQALKLNGILGVIITIGIIAAVIYILRYREHQTFAPQVSALASGAGYSGYNLIGAGVILASLSKNIKTKNEAVMTGIISGISLFFMMLLIYLLLSIYYKYINLGEIPLLTLAIRENKAITFFYCIMLMLAVVTTAISNIVGISELAGAKNTKTIIAVGAIGFIISWAGFSSIIDIAYRACGYAGIIIILYTIKRLKTAKKEDI